MTTRAQRNELRQLHAAATAGTWGESGNLIGPRFDAVERLGTWPPGVRLIRTESAGQRRQHTDIAATCGGPMAASIAATMNALPAILDDLDAAEALLRRCASVIGRRTTGTVDCSALVRELTALLADLRAVGSEPETK